MDANLARRGQLNRDYYYFFPGTRMRLRTWSREMGSAFPSRVNCSFAILRLNLVLLNSEHFIVTIDQKLLYSSTVLSLAEMSTYITKTVIRFIFANELEPFVFVL